MGRLTNTVSGNMASFRSCAGADIESLKCYFLPVQEGSGDPSPSNVREINGWNSLTTYTARKNLASAIQVYGILSTCEQVEKDGKLCIRFRANQTGEYTGIKFKENTRYTVSMDALVEYYPGYDTYASHSIFFKFYYTDGTSSANFNAVPSDGWLHLSTTSNVNKTIRAIGAYSTEYRLRTYIDINTFQIEEGIQATSYEPYCGQIIPITFPTVGKNKINAAMLSNYEGVTYSNDTIISTAGNLYNIMREKENRFKIYIPANTPFSFSCDAYTDGNETTSGLGLAMVAKYANKTSSKVLFIASNSALTNTKFQFCSTVDNPIESFRFYCYTGQNNIWHISNMQLELGDTVTEYEPYSSNNSVYGGYIDLALGKLILTHMLATFDGSVNFDYLSMTGYHPYVYKKITELGWPQAKKYNTKNSFSYVANGSDLSINAPDWIGYMDTQSRRLYITVPSTITSTLDFSTYLSLHPLLFAYVLDTPVEYPLTPIQLKTFLGLNNIWSNTNGLIEVEYDLHETKDIIDCKRRVLLALPHLATVKDSIAHFNTNMNISLKQATVEFLPIQYGSGDPSPSNVRSITGWTGILINHSGKNMLKCDTFTNGTAADITYTKHTNENNIIDYITCVGTTSSTNAFRNLNYTININKIPRGNVSVNSFSNLANIALLRPDNITNNSVRFYSSDDGAGTAASRTGWFNYNTDKFDEYMSWARILIWPNAKNTEIDTIVYPMMCHQSDRGCEYEPYHGTIDTISWENDYGTIYGGYIDLVNGKLIVEWVKELVKNLYVGINSNSATAWHNWTVYPPSTFPMITGFDTSTAPLICDTFLATSMNNGELAQDQTKPIVWGSATDGTFRFKYITDCELTAAEFKTKYGETVIAYKLATPIEYTITPQILKPFLGTNNYWSNTNGDLEIKYWTH